MCAPLFIHFQLNALFFCFASRNLGEKTGMRDPRGMVCAGRSGTPPKVPRGACDQPPAKGHGCRAARPQPCGRHGAAGRGVCPALAARPSAACARAQGVCPWGSGVQPCEAAGPLGRGSARGVFCASATRWGRRAKHREKVEPAGPRPPTPPPRPAPRPCRGLACCGPMREAVPLASGAGPVKPPQPGTLQRSLQAPSGRPPQPGGEDRLSTARPSGRCGRVAGPAVHRTCNVQGALLQGGGHGPVLPAQQGAAAPLGHFLLQPGPQLQVGLGGCVERGPVTQGRHRQPCRWCCGVMSSIPHSRVGQGPRGLWADHLPSVSPRGRTEHAHTLATSLRHRIMCALAGLPHEARAVARTL